MINVRIELDLDFLDFRGDWSPRPPLLLPFGHFVLGSDAPYLNKLNTNKRADQCGKKKN